MEKFLQAPLLAVASLILSLFSHGNGAVALQVTRQPTDAYVLVGDTARFEVTAAGEGTLAYQWYRNTTALTGATQPLLSLPGVQTLDEGATFHCVVTGAQGSVVSRHARLRVRKPTGETLALEGELADADGLALGRLSPEEITLEVRLHSSAQGDAEVYRERFAVAAGRGVRVSKGRFSVRLGEGVASGDLAETVRKHPDLWAEFRVQRFDSDEETLAPRLPLTASPYALSGAPARLEGDGLPGTLSAPPGTLYLDRAAGKQYVRGAAGWVEWPR
jgi:hypothetical protein